MNPGSMVSVVLTCYNQGKYLTEAVESIIKQTYPTWECLIINDGSTDNTEEVAQALEKIDSRIRYFHQTNQGVAAARNLGLSAIKGEFVQFLDADDYLHPQKFESQVKRLEESKEIDVVFGSSRYFFDDQPEVFYPLHFRGSPPCDITYLDKFQVEMLFKHNVCTNCAALYRKSKFPSMAFRKGIFEDWVFNLECALNTMNFHFDNSFQAQSYVRITTSSQMVKHALQANEIENFQQYLYSLVKEYKYPLTLRIVQDSTSSFQGSWKSYLRMITPPIIFSLGGMLKRKLSK